MDRLKGKKILVTGGAGFIGSHIVEDLVNSGAKVRVYDNFSSGHRENLNAVEHDVEIIEGDILDMDALINAANGVDGICHQAAQLEITRCIETPIDDLRINAEGTLIILEVAKTLNIPKVVYASSACVYGQAIFVPETEDHPTVPNWPYGVSKLAAEHYARLYHEYYEIETVGLRYSIVYGPREWYGRVLTVFLRRALDSLPPVIWGGDQQRDFIYIDDVARLNRLCLEKNGLGCEVFNVSSGTGTSIRELAKVICKVFDLGKPMYEDIPEGGKSSFVEGRIRLPAELKRMILDNSKANGKLNWSPGVNLEEGLVHEYEWLKENKHRWKKMHY